MFVSVIRGFLAGGFCRVLLLVGFWLGLGFYLNIVHALLPDSRPFPCFWHLEGEMNGVSLMEENL